MFISPLQKLNQTSGIKLNISIALVKIVSFRCWPRHRQNSDQYRLTETNAREKKFGTSDLQPEAEITDQVALLAASSSCPGPISVLC